NTETRRTGWRNSPRVGPRELEKTPAPPSPPNTPKRLPPRHTAATFVPGPALPSATLVQTVHFPGTPSVANTPPPGSDMNTPTRPSLVGTAVTDVLGCATPSLTVVQLCQSRPGTPAVA